VQSARRWLWSSLAQRANADPPVWLPPQKKRPPGAPRDWLAWLTAPAT
jgi:hypothetical protein